MNGPLGEYPAWFVPGTRDTWAIVVHGNSMSRLDGLRMVPITVDAGFPTLVPTYRNDTGAPEDPSGKLRYGLTEWRDLEAAVRYALDNGAKDVVLAGYSMGGGVIMAFLQRSKLRDDVRAVILDAPMLDFSATVDDNASREEVVPGRAAPLVAHRRREADRGVAVRRRVGPAELPRERREALRRADPDLPRDGGHDRADRDERGVRQAPARHRDARASARRPSTSRAGTSIPRRTRRRSRTSWTNRSGAQVAPGATA